MAEKWYDDDIWKTDDDRTDEGAKLTWGEIATMYAAHLRVKSEDESNGHAYDCEHAIYKLGEWAMAKPKPIPPQKFGKTAAEDYLAFYKQHGSKDAPVGDSTVNAVSRKLKTLFKWLYTEGLFPRNNLDKLANWEIKSQVRDRLSITKEEFDKLIETNRRLWSAAYDPKSRFKQVALRKFHTLRNECIITMQVDAGMRRGEVCKVRLDCLDLKNGLLTLTPDITKTKKGRVSALTMDFVNGKLAEWIAFRAKIMSKADHYPGTIFVNEKLESISPATWSDRFDRIVTEAKLDRRITTHCCRRTGSSTMDLVDRDLSKLQVGHMSDEVHDLYHVIGAAQIAKLREAKDAVGLFGM